MAWKAFRIGDHPLRLGMERCSGVTLSASSCTKGKLILLQAKLKMLVFLFSLTMVTVLLWLRLDWGVTHWAYHAYFSHFWPGVYIALAGPP